MLSVHAAWQWQDRWSRTDADRYFHYAVSRAQSTTGTLATIPQVEDLGWGERFIEKEWLFHQLTARGWRWAEEHGVDVTCELLSLLDVLLLFIVCRRRASTAASFAGVATVLSSGALLRRLVIVRPHLLGIACVLLLLWALIDRRRWQVVLSSVLFALSYHALYVPLSLGAVWWLFNRREPRPWSMLALITAGLSVGTLLSPAFPGNIQSAWATLQIALHSTSSALVGDELHALSPPDFAQWLLPSLAAFIVASALLRHDRAMRWLLMAAAAFWVLTLKTPRAAEYGLPLTAVCLAAALDEGRRRFAVPALAMAASVPGLLALNEVSRQMLYAEGIAKSVLALPTAPLKVLNCSFSEGAYLLYLRPTARFVDVLDPNLLVAKNPELARAREDLVYGRADPVETAHRFKAQYVMCGYFPARQKLEHDPRVLRVHPAPGQPEPHDSGPPAYLITARGPP